MSYRIDVNVLCVAVNCVKVIVVLYMSPFHLHLHVAFPFHRHGLKSLLSHCLLCCILKSIGYCERHTMHFNEISLQINCTRQCKGMKWIMQSAGHNWRFTAPEHTHTGAHYTSLHHSTPVQWCISVLVQYCIGIGALMHWCIGIMVQCIGVLVYWCIRVQWCTMGCIGALVYWCIRIQ